MKHLFELQDYGELSTAQLLSSLVQGHLAGQQPHHGGAVVPQDVPEREKIKVELYSALRNLAIQRDASSLTVIENPFDPLSVAEQSALDADPVDYRLGQFTRLPGAIEEPLEDHIMSTLHGVCS